MENYMHNVRISKETYELLDELNRKQIRELNESVRGFIHGRAVSILSRDGNVGIIDDEVIEEVIKEVEDNGK